MKVIVGLGNPGKRYRNTRHNVGFEVIDELARRLACRLKRSFRFRARMGTSSLGGVGLLLVKPQSYMNNSGSVVVKLLRHYGLTPADMIVVMDDADLEIGRLRVRHRGSSGGHKGLLSVVEKVGSDNFCRIRLGIGRNENAGELVHYVLDPFMPSERRIMDKVVKAGGDALICLFEHGEEKAMNEYNSWKAEP